MTPASFTLSLRIVSRSKRAASTAADAIANAIDQLALDYRRSVHRRVSVTPAKLRASRVRK